VEAKRTTEARAAVIRRIGWLAVASMLATALLAPSAGPAFAIEGGNPPTVECEGYDFYFKIDSGDLSETTYKDGDADVVTNWPGQEITISNIADGGQAFDWSSTEPVGKVVTKEGQDEFFAVYDPAVTSGSVADAIQQGLSHITFCGDQVEEPSTPPSEEPSTPPSEEPSTPPSEEPSTPPSEAPSQSVAGETDTPEVSTPPTDTIGTTSAPSDSWRMILIALASLLASVLVMTPAKAVSRR
jgi:hypothetical protein